MSSTNVLILMHTSFLEQTMVLICTDYTAGKVTILLNGYSYSSTVLACDVVMSDIYEFSDTTVDVCIKPSSQYYKTIHIL